MTQRLDCCRYCGEPIVWHEGNGGQWIGAKPPRDWMTCGGLTSFRALRHRPVGLDIPADLERATIEEWLEA